MRSEQKPVPETEARAWKKLLAPVHMEPFKEEAAAFYGTIRAELERIEKPIGGNDLFIAARALAGGFILATNNVREFSGIGGVKVENWV